MEEATRAEEVTLGKRKRSPAPLPLTSLKQSRYAQSSSLFAFINAFRDFLCQKKLNTDFYLCRITGEPMLTPTQVTECWSQYSPVEQDWLQCSTTYVAERSEALSMLISQRKRHRITEQHFFNRPEKNRTPSSIQLNALGVNIAHGSIIVSQLQEFVKNFPKYETAYQRWLKKRKMASWRVDFQDFLQQQSLNIDLYICSITGEPMLEPIKVTEKGQRYSKTHKCWLPCSKTYFAEHSEVLRIFISQHKELKGKGYQVLPFLQLSSSSVDIKQAKIIRTKFKDFIAKNLQYQGTFTDWLTRRTKAREDIKDNHLKKKAEIREHLRAELKESIPKIKAFTSQVSELHTRLTNNPHTTTFISDCTEQYTQLKEIYYLYKKANTSTKQKYLNEMVRLTGKDNIAIKLSTSLTIEEVFQELLRSTVLLEKINNLLIKIDVSSATDIEQSVPPAPLAESTLLAQPEPLEELISSKQVTSADQATTKRQTVSPTLLHS